MCSCNHSNQANTFYHIDLRCNLGNTNTVPSSGHKSHVHCSCTAFGRVDPKSHCCIWSHRLRLAIRSCKYTRRSESHMTVFPSYRKSTFVDTKFRTIHRRICIGTGYRDNLFYTGTVRYKDCMLLRSHYTCTSSHSSYRTCRMGKAVHKMSL